MISKHLPANSFYHTCRYISQKQGAEVLLSEGVRGHNYKLMAADFEMQQQLRPSKTQSCFHAILSFYPGEKPSNEAMKEIALKYLQELGITNTQYSMSKHTDKAHLHMHIVANMVNNEGKAISDSWIGLRGKKIAQRLTQENKLIPALEKNLKLTHMEALSQSEANKYKIYIAISENLHHCLTMEEQEQRLLKLGIETQYKCKGQTQERQGVSFRMDNICFKGSQVDRKYSYAGLEKTFVLQQILVQNQMQKESQRPILKEPPLSQKATIRQRLQTKSSKEHGKDRGHYLGNDLTKGMEKAIDILMKQENTNGQIPFRLTEEAERRRKKKQRQQLGL